MHAETANPYQSGLFRHSIVLLFAAQIASVSNLLFQLVMMRSLTAVEYGVLATMLSLVQIFGKPMESLRTTVAHQAGLLKRSSRTGAVRHLLRRWAVYLSFLSLGLLLAGGLGSEVIAAHFQLSSPAPVLAAVLVIAGLPFMLMCVGLLQGLQAFVWMGAVYQGWGVVRLLVGVAIVYLFARTAVAGLSAHALGVGISVAFGVLALNSLLKKEPESSGPDMDYNSMYYCFMSMMILAGYAVLTYADVMLVKRYFTPEEAGVYAKAATIGRTIIFITVPVAMALFPKVVSTGMTTANDRRLLVRALALAGALVAVTALAVSVGARFLWLVFTGEEPDGETVSLMRMVVWAMSPLGVTLLMVNFNLAQRRFHMAAPILCLAAAYILGVSIWHDTLVQVVRVLASVSVASLLAMLAGMGRTFRA